MNKNKIKNQRFILGPVFVEFPIDVLYPFHLVEREVGIKSNAKALADKIANLLVDEINKIFDK